MAPTVWKRLEQAARAAWQAWSMQQSATSDVPLSSYNMMLPPEDEERINKYRLLWKYYRGDHKKHMKVRQTPLGAGPDDNVIMNYSRRVVNKGVSFLFGKPLEWQLSEGDDTPEEMALDTIWRSDERRQAFFSELALNGGVTGDFYIQTVMGENGIPRPINLNPSLVFPRYDDTDIEKEIAFEVRFHYGQALRRTVHAMSDSGASWETWVEEMVRGQWLMVGEPVIWPFAWPMIVHGKNLPNPNNYFGTSDLEDADINDAINMAASNINRITRIFAHPLVWGRKMGVSSVAIDASQAILSPNDDATMGALQLGNNLQSSQDYLAALRTAFAEITDVPQSDPERLSIGAQSGFALKVLFNDLMLKTSIKRSLYGMAIVEANRRMLAMSGFGEENVCKLHWRDPLPVDENAEVAKDTFELDNKLASKETIATRRGIDWHAEEERIAADRAGDSNLGEMLLRAFEGGRDVPNSNSTAATGGAAVRQANTGDA